MPKLFQNLAKSGFAAAQIIELPELGVERSVAQNAIDALRGKPITNAATGISARLSSSAKGKLVSNKATGKSKSNGFSRQQHNAIVASIAEIFKAATLLVSRRDRAGDANILSIKRFAAKVRFNRQQAVAWITVKESKLHGHHIYSVEAIKLEALDRIVEVVSGNTPHASSASTRGILAFFSSCVNAVFGRKSTALLLALAGSWKFWCGAAMAGVVGAVTTVVLYRTVWAEPNDAGNYAYYRLVSNVGATTDKNPNNPNPADRVLLMNADHNDKCFVDCDDISGSTTKTKTNRNWWEYFNSDKVLLTTYNLVKGTHFALHAKSPDAATYGPVLWEMFNCRAGNLNPPKKTGTPNSYQNLLPYNTDTAYCYDLRTSVCTDHRYAGTLVMQNTPDAQVVSSCLADGIGTIYFDAVNGFDGYLNGELKVEVAYGVWKIEDGKIKVPHELEYQTNAVGQVIKDADGNKIPVPPDDAHCAFEGDPYGRCAWTNAVLTGHWWCPGATVGNDGAIDPARSLVLKMPLAGGTAGKVNGDNFYRVWVPVQDERVNPELAPHCRRPMRFRIKRVDNPQKGTSNPGIEGENYNDSPDSSKRKNALIILDNIIASFPAMMAAAVPRGDYVPGGSSRNVIGWTGVFAPEGWTGAYYPKVGDKDLVVTAGLSFKTNAVPDEKAGPAWIEGLTATMKYRWRYLSRTNDWKNAELEVRNGEFMSKDDQRVDLDEDIGDIEFYYETDLDAPYYGYVDYSGKNKMTPGYIERIRHVQSRFDATSLGPRELPSTGSDFFVRTREGVSTQLENQVVFRWKEDGEYVKTNFPCSLVADGTWKTFVRTTTNGNVRTGALPVGRYEFRVEGVNPRQVFGGADVREIPWSGQKVSRVSDEAEEGWASITLDSVTGALMFMLNESSESEGEMALSIVHADYQDFSGWTSARSDDTYTGAFFEGRGKKSGVSPDTVTYPSELPAWLPTAVSNATFWTETFHTDGFPIDGYNNIPAYRPFGESLTPNSWRAHNSMWTCAQWRKNENDARPDKKGADMALQLQGGGLGTVEYINSKELPHGVDEVRLRARLAQASDFYDFAIYEGGTASEQKDYVFSVRAAMWMDDEGKSDFDGNGTVSVIGYYRAEKGCYELRAERVNDDKIRLSLYKWQVISRGKAEATLLGCHATQRAAKSATYMRTNGKTIPSSVSESTYYGELFIRCTTEADGTVKIVAGIMNGASGAKKISDSCSGASHDYLTYTDEGKYAGAPITYGRFGFDSLNCPAQIIDARKYPKGTDGSSTSDFPSVANTPKDDYGNNSTNATLKCGTNAVKYKTGEAEDLFKEMAEGTKTIYMDWTIRGTKYEVKTDFAKDHLGLTSVDPTGNLTLYVTAKDAASPMTNLTEGVSGFKFNDVKFTVRNDADSFVKIATAASSEDVVVDDISFNQWCADSYDSGDNPSFAGKDWASGAPLNYAYLNGWVKVDEGENHTIVLQPMRAKDSGLITIRSPLMDGRNDGADETTRRGIGLGMIAFTYRNADSNCVVRLQYREIDGAGSNLRNATASADGWITAVETNFLNATDEELAKGTISAYLGLHGTRGAMRIIVDPQVVKDARATEKNPTGDPNWGSIEITGFTSRDAPGLDNRCWWGWNLRTTDLESERSIYDSLPAEGGLALALNNSTKEDIEVEPGEEYEDAVKRFAQQLPFVQTPEFGTNVAGEISFRARRGYGVVKAEIGILGIKAGKDPEAKANWDLLKTIVISNDCYALQSYKTHPGDDYMAFRIAVIGVEGVDPNYAERKQLPPGEVWRVLIDEVAVSEAVRGKVGFFDVGAFRTPLDKQTYVTNVLDVVQQPMCEEAWSVQCEIRAVQLEEEIRLGDDTEVTMYWFVTNHSSLSSSNWGYEKWKDLKGKARSAPLRRIANSDLPADKKGRFLFRGSYPETGSAVVEPSFKSGTVVQYMLEVKYSTADGDTGRQLLATGDWTKPAWYNGVDYNARFGGFAAYTILDTVAYGFAWINEVNVYDGPTPSTDISPTNQYVEVAVPIKSSIEGWKLEFITGGLADGTPLFTNTVVRYVDREKFPLADYPTEVPCKKTQNAEGDYVFITAGSPDSFSKALQDGGIIDGAWKVEDDQEHRGTQLKESGRIDGGTPMAIRLVRPSGIIEHQIVIAGTNRYATSRDPYPRTYSTTNFVKKINGTVYIAAEDTGGADGSPLQGYSSNVTNYENVVSDPSVWAHLPKTPGRVNVGEVLPVDPPTPHGTMIALLAKIANGYVTQSIGSSERTTETVVLYVRMGLEAGTNIVYDLADWHEIESIAETEKGKPTRTYGPYLNKRQVTFPAAINASNDVTLVVTTRMRNDLVEHGLTPENPYTADVLAWLENGWRGKNRDETFANPGGEIHPAKIVDLSGADTGHKLELTDMYWLDMDPTVTGLVLKAAMSDSPAPIKIVEGKTEYEDVVFGVHMEIFNECDPSFAHYAPYTLNGLGGKTSMDTSPDDWDAVTFKVTGYLMNGHDDEKDPDKVWMPLRYFVFDRNSFDPATFEAKVQVKDPFFQVEDWLRFYGTQVFFKWHIDSRRFGAWSTDVLKPDSTFHEGE